MKVDRFTKTVLTVMAVCLVLLTLKEYDIISDAEAQGPTDVNIVTVAGKFPYRLYDEPGITDVNIVQIGGRWVPKDTWRSQEHGFLPVRIQARTTNNTQIWWQPTTFQGLTWVHTEPWQLPGSTRDVPPQGKPGIRKRKGKRGR